MLHLTFGKTFKWEFKNSTRKNDALIVITTICQNESKKLPKLVNVDMKKITKNSSIDLRVLKKKDGQETTDLVQAKGQPVSRKIEKIVPDLDLVQILSNFKWEASKDAAVLEKTLQEEILALDAVIYEI